MAEYDYQPLVGLPELLDLLHVSFIEGPHGIGGAYKDTPPGHHVIPLSGGNLHLASARKYYIVKLNHDANNDYGKYRCQNSVAPAVKISRHDGREGVKAKNHVL